MQHEFTQCLSPDVPIGTATIYREPTLWFAEATVDGFDLQIGAAPRGIFKLPAAAAGLIGAAAGVPIMHLRGAGRFQRLPLPPPVKLLAFLECGTPTAQLGRGRSDGIGVVVGAADDALRAGNLENWLIGCIARRDPAAAPLLDFLRRQEAYWVVRYLLHEYADASGASRTVAALGERYGLSPSHFRRICRRALGATLKTELRRWRAANAVLDATADHRRLVDVALSHGFASSSHFSHEIKQLFGMSPCQIRLARQAAQ